jgi:hypothetical protein
MRDSAPRLLFGVENDVPLLGFPHGTGTFEENKAIIQFRLAVQQQERERTIALLTETHRGLKAVLAMAHPEGDGSEIIALIKGEN